MPNPASHAGKNPITAKGMQMRLYKAAQSKFCLIIFIVRLACSINLGIRWSSPFRMMKSDCA